MHGGSGALAMATAAAGDDVMPPVGGTDAFRSGSLMSEEVCRPPLLNTLSLLCKTPEPV